MPVVSIAAFVEGSDDDAVLQGGPLGQMGAGLTAIRSRDGVSDRRLGVTIREGEMSLPAAEGIFLVTEATPAEAHGWRTAADIYVGEIGAGEAHRPRGGRDEPDGQRMVWAWIE